MIQNRSRYLETVYSETAHYPPDFHHHHNKDGHPDQYMNRGVMHARVVIARWQATVLQLALRIQRTRPTCVVPFALMGVM